MKNLVNYLDDYFDENIEEQLINRKLKKDEYCNYNKHNKHGKHNKQNKQNNEEE